MFPTIHPAHAKLETGGSCLFIEPFSARGSLAETEASQRLVVAICLIPVIYASGPTEKQVKFRFFAVFGGIIAGPS